MQIPSFISTPQILIDASNGASDYGNKFGEPLIAGYTRTYGQRLLGGERREWIKPIMFRRAAPGGQCRLQLVLPALGLPTAHLRRRRAGGAGWAGAECCVSSPLRSAGLGQIDHSHLYKNDPELGMLIVKIGGPAYRIGMGGGAASSVPSGSNSADLDFNAVQVGRER